MVRLALAALMLALVAPGLAAPVPAAAAERAYALRPTDSALRFTYTEDGDAKRGGFKTFSAEGRFDPQRLERASLRLTIRTASVQLSDAFRTNFVQGADWFDSDAHPEAVYVLDGLIRVAPDAYIAVGALTIKGVSKRVSVPLRLTLEGDRARAVGDLTFNRKDFRIGGGPASLFVAIGDTITVAFDLIAEARP